MPLVNHMIYFKAIIFPTHSVFLFCSAYAGNLEAAFLMFEMDEKGEGCTTLMFHKAQAMRFSN